LVVRATAFLLVASLLFLAGCSSPGKDSVPEPTTPPPNTDSTIPAGLSAAVFPNAAPTDLTIWANGTLKPEQAGGVSTPAFGVGRPDATVAATVDVTELGVAGLPIILEATLDSTMAQGSAFAFFSIPGDEFRNNAFGQPVGGKHHVESGLVRSTSEPITLNLFYQGLEPSAEVPYTLSAHVKADPSIIRAAFPVGIMVTNGTREITVDLLGQQRDFAFDLDVPNLMLWAPDDTFLGHHALAQGRTTIQLPNGDGEYVAMLSQGGRSMRILTNATSPAELRAMPQTFVVSDPHPGSTATKAEWTTTYETVPVLAGVFFTPSTFSPDMTVLLESPKGPLLNGMATGPWLHVPQVPNGALSAFFGWDSAYAVPNLVAGDYHVSVSSPMAVGADPIQGSDFSAFWSR
jgi:hypothetical protein